MRAVLADADGAGMRTPHLLAGSCASADPEAAFRHAELAIWDELVHSLARYPRPWRSAEEGAMVLGEEVAELWDDVRGNRIGCARAEAAQVGAMAVRFLVEVCEPGGAIRQRCRDALAEQGRRRSEVGPRGRALASSHEGFGFLKREFDALWCAVCNGESARSAAQRVAAGAVRFIAEIGTAPPGRSVR